ncbi:Interleukin enhancer-binding factor 2 [Dermatophagoides pteronyssinus]|nr:Interleukin enhancer-binding factor 2 [Dermatophagoides pteronyssinus]
MPNTPNLTKQHLLIKSTTKKNKRHRTGMIAVTNVLPSSSQKSSNHQHHHHNVVAHSSSTSKSNLISHSFDPGIDTNSVSESFDLMKIPYAPIQPTFDYYLVNDHFPAANLNSNDLDDTIKQAIDERLSKIMPRSDDIQNLTQTVSKLMLILDRLKASPENIDACKIDCFFVVGSLRMGTMIRDHRIADMVIILQTLPVKAALSAIGNKLLEELQRIEPTNPYQINIRDDNLELTNLFNKDIIRILIATTTTNLNKLDREIHVRKNAVQKHLKATVHARWFEENIKWNDVRDFIRLFKDVCQRFNEFSYFSPWMIIILCHYSMTCIRGTNAGSGGGGSNQGSVGEDHLPIHLAFKRLLQLLSSGIFLPYSAGITDPCEPKMPIHGKLSVHDQETITRQAQTLLRLLNYQNGCRYVFGLESLIIINDKELDNDSDNSSSTSSSSTTTTTTSSSSTAKLAPLMMKQLELVDKDIIDQIKSNDEIDFRKSYSVFDTTNSINQTNKHCKHWKNNSSPLHQSSPSQSS